MDSDICIYNNDGKNHRKESEWRQKNGTYNNIIYYGYDFVSLSFKPYTQ